VYNLTEAQKPVTTIAFSGGGGVLFPLSSWIDLSLFARSGYSYGFLEAYNGETVSGGGIILNGGVRAETLLSPSFKIALSAGYRYEPGSFEGLSGGVGIRWELGSQRAGPVQLKFEDARILPVFPVFYSHYDANNLGTVTIRNEEPGDISNIRVSFFVDQYMERPKLSSEIPLLKRGAMAEIPLYALFRDDILSVVEETAVSGEIQVTYTYRGIEKSTGLSRTISIINRNGMTWDDDRKAAAFVSPKDPLVIQFARLAAGAARREGLELINENFMKALAVYEMLGEYGLSYVIDPQTPYIEFYQNKNAVDYLQFPRQTIQYKSGDCDDLSILYAALLESLGIATAFITVPGHIYVAFDLGISPREALQTFSSPDSLVIHDQKVWLPVEITLVGDSFTAAWEYGASEWRKYNPEGKAVFVEMQKAWQAYQPVGFTRQETASNTVALPGESEVTRRYQESTRSVIDHEIDQWKSLIASRYANRNEPAALNKLGSIYARYGRYEEAERQFNQIMRQTDSYFPALVNLGNIAFLEENFGRALELFTRAYLLKPGHNGVLISLAKAHYELGNGAVAAQYYQQAAEKDDHLAERFAYLSTDQETTARAGSAELRRVMVWTEEEQ
jgi:tetratricopeptide (TPR) repeat protein